MSRLLFVLAFTLAASVGLRDVSAQATFEPILDLPNGVVSHYPNAVSADGRVIVGTARTNGGSRAFRWSRESGMVLIPRADSLGSASATSGDGSVVVGETSSHTGRASFLWSARTGTVFIDDPPRGYSVPTSVSDDGSVVVGFRDAGNGQRAFWWTARTGLVDISALGGGGILEVASAVSGDGFVVAGRGKPPVNGHAYRIAGTDVSDLGDLSGGQFTSWPDDMSSDGRVIVGFSSAPNMHVGFRWTSDDGMKPLDPPPSLPGWALRPLATNADGSVVVGTMSPPDWDDLRRKPFIWDAHHGSRELELVLTEYGADLRGWRSLSVDDVSADGLTLVGSGADPRGGGGTFVATLPATAIPEPRPLVLLLGLRLLRGRRRPSP